MTEIRKNDNTVYRVTSEWIGRKEWVHVREWFEADDGSMRPGKRGLRLTRKQARAIAHAIFEEVGQ